MNSYTKFQITIITKTIEPALAAEGWLVLGRVTVPPDQVPRGPMLTVDGVVAKDGRHARICQAQYLVDERGEHLRVILQADEGDEIIRVERRIGTVVVCTVPGAPPPARPEWAHMDNANRARQACIDAGATNGDFAHSAVLHGHGDPPGACVLGEHDLRR